MIRGFCRTNLDEAKHQSWPTVFVAVPRIGEYVQAEGTRHLSQLRVCSVTHYMTKNKTTGEVEPFIEVELNK